MLVVGLKKVTSLAFENKNVFTMWAKSSKHGLGLFVVGVIGDTATVIIAMASFG